MAQKKVWTPSILVLDEKHGTIFMDASTEEALHRSALSVLRGRMNLGYWYSDDPEFIIEAKRAINKKDGKYAYQLLKDRRHAEYEGFQVEPLQSKYLKEDNE